MERTKSSETNKTLPLWLKIGGGSMRINKQIIKPGQKFRALESDIPAAFRDLVVLQEEGTAVEAKASVAGGMAGTAHMVKPSNPLVFTKEPTEVDPTLFNVKNRRGKIMNQQPLSEADADKLIAELK